MNQNDENNIVIQGIEKEFGDKKVLQDISLEVKKGEILGFLGPSGAGKTTLIKILTGQLLQTSGEAYLLGQNTRNLKEEVYGKIGLVLDNTGVYKRLSCYDNLVLFTRIHGVPKSRIGEVLERVGLSDAVKRPVYQLSKGMEQRLVLARALLHEPEILFLDEPTSGLDPATAEAIHQLIREQKEQGKTVFLTTHNMEEATKLCDRVALLKEGNIVECGSPKEVCGKYDHSNEIRILLTDGKEVMLTNGAESAAKIAEYFQKNIVDSIHSMEPTLETVFMEVTANHTGK